jgi:4-hydroxy-tetrahydrodipicolinate synthase
MNQFKGTGVAMVTPFKDGDIDFPALEKVINHLINGGIDYSVALGTTGESATMSTAERYQLLDFVVEKVAGRVPLVAGFGTNDTRDLLEDIEGYHFKGIDAILSVSPYYNKPTQEGIFQHYMAIEKASPVPIIIYNVPSRTASNISAETTLRLANASKKFIAVKEASGDFRQIMELIAYKPDGFLVISGDDNITLPLLSLGVDGVISVVGNVYPKVFSDMVNAGMNEDFVTARKLHYQLMPILDLLFVDGNPPGIKCAMNLLKCN